MEYQNMTNEQIKRRIEWIDRELFCIDMKDRWDVVLCQEKGLIK